MTPACVVTPEQGHFRVASPSGKTAQIPLNHDLGLFAVVDADDYPALAGYRWHAKKTTTPGVFYAVRTVFKPGSQERYRSGGRHRQLLWMHRVILGAVCEGRETDHVNGDGLDNRRCNLRPCSRVENNRNRRFLAERVSRFKTQFRGVYRPPKKGRWRAFISTNGKKLLLGTFATDAEAAAAYDRAALQHYGAFARLNFPQETA